MTTCLSCNRRTASATRCGSSSSRAKGFAVETAQNPQARVQRSPAIIIVAVPWLRLMVALIGLERVTRTVSFGSTAVSPRTGTLKVWVVVPVGKVSVVGPVAV